MSISGVAHQTAEFLSPVAVGGKNLGIHALSSLKGGALFIASQVNALVHHLIKNAPHYKEVALEGLNLFGRVVINLTYSLASLIKNGSIEGFKIASPIAQGLGKSAIKQGKNFGSIAFQNAKEAGLMAFDFGKKNPYIIIGVAVGIIITEAVRHLSPKKPS